MLSAVTGSPVRNARPLPLQPYQQLGQKQAEPVVHWEDLKCGSASHRPWASPALLCWASTQHSLRFDSSRHAQTVAIRSERLLQTGVLRSFTDDSSQYRNKSCYAHLENVQQTVKRVIDNTELHFSMIKAMIMSNCAQRSLEAREMSTSERALCTELARKRASVHIERSRSSDLAPQLLAGACRTLVRHLRVAYTPCTTKVAPFPG